MTHHTCPVCGFDGLEEPPTTPECGDSYEICSCCGFQFGVSDGDRGFTYEGWRQAWISNGMRWWSTSRAAPPGWDPVAQLRRVDAV